MSASDMESSEHIRSVDPVAQANQGHYEWEAGLLMGGVRVSEYLPSRNEVKGLLDDLTLDELAEVAEFVSNLKLRRSEEPDA